MPTPGLSELSHYAKFKRIADGIDGIGDVWPVPNDPCPDDFDFKGTDGKRLPAADLATLFDAANCYVLCLIDKLYATVKAFEDESPEGGESDRYGIERQFLAAMGGLLFPIADLLVRQPVSPSGAIRDVMLHRLSLLRVRQAGHQEGAAARALRP
jgi:hypothetical protein